MTLSAREVASAVLDSNDPTVQIGAWIVSHLTGVGQLPEITAWEEADNLQPNVVALIDRSIARAQSRGVQPTYVWADMGRTILARPHLLASAADKDAEAMSDHTRGAIWDAIGDLSGSAFERVCEHLLDLYGVNKDKRKLVGHAGDGGIDFYGVLRPYPLPGSERLMTLGRRFVGQAKRSHKADVPNDLVEAFGSRLGQIRAGMQANPVLPEWFVTSQDPIVGIFMTAGHLGPTARAIAVRTVTYAIEGDQVAEDLSRSPSIGQWLNETGTTIDKYRFVDYFESHA